MPAGISTNPLTMKSYSSNIAVWAGGPITWWSRIQKTIALSTAKAELVAVTNAARQALYLRRILHSASRSNDQSKSLTTTNLLS